MSHMRQQILDAIAAAVTGLTTTTTHVWVGRVAPLQRADVPGLIVRSGNERIDAETYPRPRMQQRFFQVDVLVHVRETDTFEEDLNMIFQEVEEALAGNVLATIKSITLRNIEPPQRVQNEVTYVQAAMNYEVFYITAENAPDTPV